VLYLQTGILISGEAAKYIKIVISEQLSVPKKIQNVVQIVPDKIALEQNYPNPFNPATTINYQLPQKSYVTLKIYDILGSLVKTLIDQEIEAGYHSIRWNASGLASGVYFYRLNAGSFVSTKKLILMK